MERKTKILMIVTGIIVIILISLIIYFSQTNKTQENKIQEENTQNEIQENTQVDENNTSEMNNITNENIVEDQNETDEEIPNIQNPPQQEVVGREERETEKIEKTDDEKAIELAKNKWGANDNTVTYSIATKNSSDEYIVSVSDSKTTVLAWYSVNISTGEVIEQ